MREKPYYVERAAVFPSDVAWFTPHVPTGTALELEHRSLAFGCDRPVPLPQVERWDSMKPHDMWPARRLVWLRAPGVPAFEDVERALARVIPYDLRVSRHMFESLEATSAQYESVARTMCRLDVDECASLAAQLVADGHEAEGASVYDSYADRARNAVAVANNVGWLVNYYWDTGRHERAAELAEYAGDVGSSTGLEIHGSVLEREGREEEARKVFEHIADRYRSGMALAGYYLRVARRTGDPKWVERAAAAVPKVFPRGIERAEIEWLPAPPTDGMAFVTFGRRAARTGLRASDVVVALDGYRMRTFDQYHVIARGSFEPRMHFIVWRDRKYQRVDADVPQRWLGVWLDNHPTSKPPRLIR